MTDTGVIRPTPARLAPESFQARTFTDTAVTLLRDMILSGGFEPGARLNELALSEQLGISRSPIREALQALAGQGLVRIVPGRGSYVMDFDLDSIRQLGEVRIALETRAAHLAASRATEAQLNQLASMLNVTDEALKAGETYPPELDFHRAILGASGNPRLIAFAEEVDTQFMLARTRSGREPARASAAYLEHLAIFTAIRDGHAEAAGQAMEVHLTNSTNNIVGLITSGGTAVGGMST